MNIYIYIYIYIYYRTQKESKVGVIKSKMNPCHAWVDTSNLFNK